MIRMIQMKDIPEYIELLSHLSPAYADAYNMPFLKTILQDYFRNGQKEFVVKEFENKLVATGSILLESKLSYGGCKVAHIEDVVVLPEYRRRGFGEEIVNTLVDIARAYHCRKVVLSCNDKNISFYNKLGFTLNQNEMRMTL